MMNTLSINIGNRSFFPVLVSGTNANDTLLTSHGLPADLGNLCFGSQLIFPLNARWIQLSPVIWHCCIVQIPQDDFLNTFSFLPT